MNFLVVSHIEATTKVMLEF